MAAVTIKDIARICGVGVSTVSRAINDHPDINRETKEKIQAAIREYNYVPNNSARNLKRIESNTIAVLIKGIYNVFITDMVTEGEQYIKYTQYSLHLQQVYPEEDEVDIAIELVKEKRLKGIIFLGGFFNHSADKLKLIEVPYIMMTVSPSPRISGMCSSVYVDDEIESYKMVDYLYKQGHRKIALITTPESERSIGYLRAKGYFRALRDNGIEPDERLVRRMEENTWEFSISSGYQVTKQLLKDNVDFTALYACSDYAAIGACKAIFEAGKSVPGDYSVAGYDGLEIGRYYNPSITTISQPIHEMLGKTFELLLDEINGQKSHQTINFSGKMLIGGSVKRITDGHE